MELNEIEYFLALASCGNISKAAEQLYMSQSALSQFLTKTEGRLGTKLFHRNRSGLTLTDAGQIYFEAASRINEIQTQALQSIDYQTRTVQGTLRLGNITFLENSLINNIGIAYTTHASMACLCKVERNNSHSRKICNLFKGAARTCCDISIHATSTNIFSHTINYYSVAWLFENTWHEGRKFTATLNEHNVKINFTLYCRVISNQHAWHRCGDVDDSVSVTYKVIPPMH